MSQGGLGKALGVSRQTINSIENGRYLPSLPLALAIARNFDSTVGPGQRRRCDHVRGWGRASATPRPWRHRAVRPCHGGRRHHRRDCVGGTQPRDIGGYGVICFVGGVSYALSLLVLKRRGQCLRHGQTRWHRRMFTQPSPA